jgi:hypothetical protein
VDVIATAVGNSEQKVGTVFSKHFSMVPRPNIVLTPLKVPRKDTPDLLFYLPKSSFGGHKVVTKDHSIARNQHIASQCDVATIFCNHLANILQKIVASQENQYIRILCSPNEDFGGPTNVWERIFEALFKGVSTRFGLRYFEITSKMRSKMFVRTSKIFVWGA